MITHSFGIVNYLVLFGYLLAMMLVGVYFSRRQKTADDYFRGGGRVPGWAAGVSVFATTLSSITFMSIPAKAFTSDWTFVYHWSVSGYRNFTAGFLFLYSVFSEIESHISL